MKKIIALALCLLTALAGIACAEEDMHGTFPPTFTDSLELDAEGWLESKDLAGLLAGSLTCDMLMNAADSSAPQLPSLKYSFFVGTADGETVTIICRSAGDRCLVLTYKPGSAEYTVYGEETDPRDNSAIAEEMLTEKYYMCSGTDVTTYVSRVGVMMSADD